MTADLETASRSAATSGRRDLGDPLAIRVGFASDATRRLLGGAVDAVAAERSKLGSIDLLVVGPGTEDAPPELIEAARAASVPVLAYVAAGDPGGLRGAGLPSFGDVEAGPQTIPLAAGVDPRAYNPKRFRAVDVAGYQAAVDAGVEDISPALGLLGRIADSDPIALLAPPGLETGRLPGGVRRSHHRKALSEREIVESAQSRLGAVDHPSFHADELARAAAITRLCASGVPVIADEPSERLRELLGERLAGLLDGLSPADLVDLDARERISVEIRRAALREHTDEAHWRRIAALAGIDLAPRPKVSILLATRRENWLRHGLLQVARQSYRPLELILCLHGDGFSDDVERLLAESGVEDGRIVRIDGALTLGDALNAGIEASSGQIVTKMDDDDWYNADHIWDLVLALEYAEADLTGKGAEFCYLEGMDLTIRRFKGDAESEHPRLAGGSIMGRKPAMQAIGGWPSRSRGEDTWVVKNMKAAGRRSYRTHGFGYILNRHGRDHTWNTFVDYFLVQSQREYRGLRLDETAIESDAEAGLRPD